MQNQLCTPQKKVETLDAMLTHYPQNTSEGSQITNQKVEVVKKWAFQESIPEEEVPIIVEAIKSLPAEKAVTFINNPRIQSSALKNGIIDSVSIG